MFITCEASLSASFLRLCNRFSRLFESFYQFFDFTLLMIRWARSFAPRKPDHAAAQCHTQHKKIGMILEKCHHIHNKHKINPTPRFIVGNATRNGTPGFSLAFQEQRSCHLTRLKFGAPFAEIICLYRDVRSLFIALCRRIDHEEPCQGFKPWQGWVQSS